MNEIINYILPWCKNIEDALSWYKNFPLPSFNNMTAESLVDQGRIEDVKKYLNRINSGGYS